MKLFIDKFGWNIPIYKSSDMNINTKAEARVIEIVKQVGGDTYLSGIGGRNYQSEEHFKNVGIRLLYTNFKPLEYQQQWGNFLPNMSVLDYCMNQGYSKIDKFFRMIGEIGTDGE